MSNSDNVLFNRLKYKLPRMRLCLVHERGQPRTLYAIRTPVDAAKLVEPLKHQPEEHFVSLHLNSRHEVIGLHEVSHGTLSASLVHPREVFKAALLANSHAILVCHNHPSGSTLNASPEDLETTRQLLSASKFLGISVLDHIIISPVHSPYSVREHYPHLWD
jgi:DNA repair protein RadC